MGHLRHHRLGHAEREMLNEQAPDVEKAVNAIWIERIGAFVESMADADDHLSWPAHWLHSETDADDCETYCLPCAEKAVDRLNAEHAASRRDRIGPPIEEKNEEKIEGCADEPWSVDGGFESEDGMAVCTACGCMLDYHLGGSTLDDEIHHFLDARPSGPVTNATEAVEISRILSALADLGPCENDAIEQCLRLIDIVDMTAITAEIAARRSGTWTDDIRSSKAGPSLAVAA